VNQTTTDPTDLHQQRLDAEARVAAEELERKQEAEDWKWLMAHKAGRRLTWKLLADCGVFRTPFNHSGSITAFNCGRHAVGLELLGSVMEHVPDALHVMQKEHTK